MQTPCQHDHPLVTFKQSPIHGRGGFARVDLRHGTRIVEYVGPKLSKAEAQTELDRCNAYIFTLDDDEAIDGSVAWNMARLLNHSCAPNGEVRVVHRRIWLYARRDIIAGEELTYNYGQGLGGYQDRPCHCGASICVGYMVAEKHFATVQQRQSF